MERLTYLKDGRWRIDLSGGQRCFYSQLFIDRLSAYENTGFTPEEFKELNGG